MRRGLEWGRAGWGALRAADAFARAVAAPYDRAPPTVHAQPGADRVGDRFRLVSWNIQYAAGRSRRMFYDGGTGVRVTAEEVRAVLAGIAGEIRALAPDVVLLQEVDRGSDRTARIDQHAWLAGALALPVDVSTPYHRNAYVPHPPHEHLGRVDMHLSVFSRFAVTEARRTPLALLDESPVRQAFNLRRALLELRLACAAGGELWLGNTHLSAFSFGDGTLATQARQVADAAARADQAGARWAVAGDFNALPPGDDPGRLGEDASLYPESVSPLAPLFARGRAATGDGGLLHPAGRTWVPWGSNLADRTLDYVFFGPGLRAVAHLAAAAGAQWSDHLPLVTDFVFEAGDGSQAGRGTR